MALVTEAQKGPADILKTLPPASDCLHPVALLSSRRPAEPFIPLGLRNDPQCCVHIHVAQHLMSEVFLPPLHSIQFSEQGLSLNLELSLNDWARLASQ